MAVSLDKATDWEAAIAALGMTERLGEFADKAVLQEAHFLRKKVIEGFSSEGPEGTKWTPLSKLTLAMRALQGFTGTKILQRSADLRNSVMVIPIPGGGAFVGVSRTATRKSGGDPVNIAAVHEFGKTIRVTMTDPMRRLLFLAMKRAGIAPRARGSRGTGGGPHTIVIRIPPRPFLGPVFDRYAQPEAMLDSIGARVAKMMRGAIGTPEGKPR